MGGLFGGNGIHQHKNAKMDVWAWGSFDQTWYTTALQSGKTPTAVDTPTPIGVRVGMVAIKLIENYRSSCQIRSFRVC